jgi:serine/threonine protein kinase
MFEDLRSSPYVRVSDDACPEESVFAYKYLRDHLLSFVQKDIPLLTMKRILRDALRGIAALHSKGIVHTDIKANNILVEWKEQNGEIIVEQVQVADVEDAAYVPENCVIRGRQVGNWMWRSPEAHASAAVHTPSDMFSFGLVVNFTPLLTLLLLKPNFAVYLYHHKASGTRGRRRGGSRRHRSLGHCSRTPALLLL